MSPASTASSGGGGHCGGQVFAREHFLELGVLDTVIVVVDVVSTMSGVLVELAVSSWKANYFVGPFHLAHATDSGGQRVVGEGHAAIFTFGNCNIFDGWF